MINKVVGVAFLIFIFLSACFSDCQKQGPDALKVVASAVPHAEMLEFIKPDLKALGINLKIIVAEDYQMPNRALAEKEVDANFFQHQPYFAEQVRQFKYPLKSFASIELEPMGIYSKKLKNLSELSSKAKIALPNDPTNEGRALLMLQAHNLIRLADGKNLNSTTVDIVDNPKSLQFIEVDAAMLPRTLEDVDVAIINTNYALQANLNPLKDALALEGKDSSYVNILAIRSGDEDRADLIALKNALTSPKMKAFIVEKYQGAIVPAF